MSSDLLTLQEAAALLGVSTATLRNWDRTGVLRAVRDPSNNYRKYRREDVVAMQEQLGLPTPAEIIEASRTKAPTRRPMSLAEVRRVVRSLHRVLRDGEGHSSLIERFDELTKLLYLRAHEERDPSIGPLFALPHLSPASEVGHRVRAAFESLVSRNPQLFPERFRRISLSDQTIQKLAGILESVSVFNADTDVKGLVYEEVIRNTFDKGENQQFFTPRHIVEFMVEMAGESLSGLICDPACGTGGFLLSVARHAQGPVDLLGFEVDERLAWATRMNLDMHGVSSFSVLHTPAAGSLGDQVVPYFGKVDAILTNPPFGSDLTQPEALERFELGRGRTSVRRGVLFIERCLDLLRPGGTLAIIIDDSVLNAPSNIDARRLILNRAHVEAVVSLPDSAFMPYATVKSSILFMRKRDNTTRGGNKTFFAQAATVGRRPNGDALMRRNSETGALELDSDLPHILTAYRLATAGSGREDGNGDAVFFASIPAVDGDDFVKAGLRLDWAFHHPARRVAENALRSASFPLVRLASLCRVRREILVPARDLPDEEITYVGLANIEAGTGRAAPQTILGEELRSGVARFEAGDIIFATMRPELRKVWVVPPELDEGFCSAECLVLVPIRSGDGGYVMQPELLAAILRSDLAYGQIMHLVTGIGRPRISRGAVLNISLPLPPVEEQERILAAYRATTGEADHLISTAEQALAGAKRMREQASKDLVERLVEKAAALTLPATGRQPGSGRRK